MARSMAVGSRLMRRSVSLFAAAVLKEHAISDG